MFQENISLFRQSLFLFCSLLSQNLANFLLIAFCISPFCIDHPLRKESSSEPFEELLSWGKTKSLQMFVVDTKLFLLHAFLFLYP